MHQLDLHQYDRVRPLFANLRDNLVVDSVLDGHTPGWVYAGDADAPRVAWLWNRMDAMLVAGVHPARRVAVEDGIDDEVVAEVGKEGADAIVLV